MLTIKYNDHLILPSRKEYPMKSFSNDDVPNGTESVIYKAASILNNMNGIKINIPVFSSDDIESLILDEIDLIDSIDKQDLVGFIQYDDRTPLLDQNKVINPTEEEIENNIDFVRGFTEEKAIKLSDKNNIGLEKAKNRLRRTNGIGKIIPDLTFEESKNMLIEKNKRELATSKVLQRISQFLIVPSISNLLEEGTKGRILEDSKSGNYIIFRDNSKNFNSWVLEWDEYLLMDGGLYKIIDIINSKQLLLQSGPDSEINVDTPYKIVDSEIYMNFDYSHSEASEIDKEKKIRNKKIEEKSDKVRKDSLNSSITNKGRIK